MEKDHFGTAGHNRLSRGASRTDANSCSPSSSSASPPVEVIIFANTAPTNNITTNSCPSAVDATEVRGTSGSQSVEDFYQGQILRRRSQVQALKLQRAERTSSFVTATTATTDASTSNDVKSVGSGGWRNRIISRYNSSMLELSTMARNRNMTQNMHNATWGESKQDDTMDNSSLFSTPQIIHQNRERLFLELLRPSISSETLSSPKADLPSHPNQEADNKYDTLQLDTITADSARSLTEMILARREQRRKSIASLRELRRKSESIPVMINQHLNQHQQHQQQQTQGINATTGIIRNSCNTHYAAGESDMPTATTTTTTTTTTTAPSLHSVLQQQMDLSHSCTEKKT